MTEKWGQLLNKLIKLTRQGDLIWKESSDKDLILSELGEFHIEVEFNEIYSQYEVRVSDLGHRLLDKFNDDELTRSGYINAYSDFADLFAFVRRINSGAEKALDDVLAVLNEKDSTANPF